MSNHPPYLYPKSAAFERIKTNGQNESRLNAFKYSDWVLGNFISEFKKLPLYERTIFVILGDHGFISDDYNQNTSIELASYHIPCLVIAPGLTPGINNRIASQVDIIPTILDLLGGSFIHHSWGKSLLSPPSINDFAIVVPSGMNHIAGMIKENTFLIYNFLGGTELYAIPNFPNQYQLKKIQEIAPKHLEMEKTMLGYLKMASHTLNTYKCGIILDE
jgi:phosphoglycerol transferase MdoB-like AlkP superfamily enzyme